MEFGQGLSIFLEISQVRIGDISGTFSILDDRLDIFILDDRDKFLEGVPVSGTIEAMPLQVAIPFDCFGWPSSLFSTSSRMYISSPERWKKLFSFLKNDFHCLLVLLNSVVF